MKEDEVMQYYRVEYNKEYNEAIKSGVVPSAKNLLERFGFENKSSSWFKSIFG